ncbi:MAG TPA: cytochrome c [Vicinamibacterales bacterium]|nr:cytochrome c [Vicinamibacterales bacterium]
MFERQFGRRVKRAIFYGCAVTLAMVGYTRTATLVAQSGSAPTFNADVAPILFEKCATCHRPGAGGPMSLTSYREVRPWARSIKARITRREMPPWSADSRFGHFSNDISLSNTQLDTIAKWVDAGMPEGAGAAPAVPKYPEGGWRLVNGRPPDVILDMPMEYELPAEGQVPIFRLWDKNPFKEDVFVEALQIRPTNPAVTHHSALYGRKLPEGTTLQKSVAWPGGPVISFIPTYADGSIVNVLSGLGGNSSSSLRENGEAGNGDITSRFKAGDKVPVINKSRQDTEEDDERLMFYLPGADFQQFAPGAAKRIRAGNALMWEVHYSPDGKPEKDRERIGLWLVQKDKVQKQVHILRNGSGQHIIENQEVGNTSNLPPIPAGASDWKITAIQPFTQDVTLNTMQPHMHLRGKDMTYIAKYPDGHEEILLSVPRYDFNWQNTYIPNRPIKLPAGTVLETVGHYDNSVRNRVNPTPNRPALWSEQTWDEMYNAWTEITYDSETNPNLTTKELREAEREASKNNPITTVVGCVAPGSSPLAWRMSSAAKLPAPAPKAGQESATPEAAAFRANHNVTKDEQEAAAKLPIGADTFELIGVADFVAPEQSLRIDTRKALYPLERLNSTGALAPNRRVAAKGVWIPGTPARINLTSVVVLSESCGVSAAN